DDTDLGHTETFYKRVGTKDVVDKTVSTIDSVTTTTNFFYEDQAKPSRLTRSVSDDTDLGHTETFYKRIGTKDVVDKTVSTIDSVTTTTNFFYEDQAKPSPLTPSVSDDTDLGHTETFYKRIGTKDVVDKTVSTIDSVTTTTNFF